MLVRSLFTSRNHVQKRFNKRSYASKSVVYDGCGYPTRVLRVEDSPAAEVGADSVQVQMLYAPITGDDLRVVSGWTSSAPSDVPVVAGNSGVAKVVSVGSNVKDIKVGQLVVPAVSGLGTWRNEGVVSRNDILAVEGKEQDLVDYYSHCTAVRLLEDFASLQSGDTIVVNGAGKVTGQAVLQLAESKGIKTIAIVNENEATNVKATVVVTKANVGTNTFRKKIADLPAPKLAVDLVGGRSGLEAVRLLQEQGNLVVCGAVDPAVTTSTSALIFKDITISGFSLHRWLSNSTTEQKTELLNNVVALQKKGTFKKSNQKVVAFSKFNEALEQSLQNKDGSSRIVLKL